MCYGNILEASMRHARKAHRCTFCNRVIAPGQPYEAMKFAGHGEGIHSQHHCLDCATRLRCVDSDDGCITDFRELQRTEAEVLGWRKWRSTLREARDGLLAKLKPRRRAAGGGA